jgi:DNA-binding CsgD family transcriptional regulator
MSRRTYVLGDQVTEREAVVVFLLAHGNDRTEIGKALHISPHTVKSHMDHLYKKTGCRTTGGLVGWAYRNKYLPIPHE